MTERRLHNRLEGVLGNEIEVEVKGSGDRHPTMIHSLSIGGGFLETKLPLTVGAASSLVFKTPAGGETAIPIEVTSHRSAGAPGLIGFGFAWRAGTDGQRAFLLGLITSKAVRSPARLGLSAANRRVYALTACAAFGGYLLSLLSSGSALLHVGLSRGWQWAFGIGATSLIALAMLIAVRRRGSLGLARGGSYDTWVGLHVIAIAVAQLLLSAHVSSRLGGFVPLACAVLAAFVFGSGLPGLILWKRRAGSRLGAVVQRHWLKVHVFLLGPFWLAVAWHAFQVTYF